MGEVGKDVFYDNSKGQVRNCSDICDQPTTNVKACRYYCPDYAPSTPSTTVSALSTTSIEYDSISTYINKDFVILGTVLAVVFIGAFVLLGCMLKRPRIVRFIKNSKLYMVIFPPRRGIPATIDEQTGLHLHGDTCVLNLQNETARFSRGQPEPAAIPSGGAFESNPTANELLLPNDSHETDDRRDFRDGHTSDRPSVGFTNDHFSTDLKRPVTHASTLAEDGNTQPNDEAVALLVQSQEDGLAANEKRSVNNQMIRRKKDMKLGCTKPLPSEPLPSEQMCNQGRAKVVADNGQLEQTANATKDEATLILETKTEENQHGLNQSMDLIPQSMCPVPRIDTNGTSHPAQTTGLVQSALNEEFRRRDPNIPLVANRNGVAQDTEDDVKRTENALNEQVPFPNITH
ncbi:uncharacterized protein LOC128211022 [Mya arenaria]|nr:uncharacterized protein LOC128211022 [Mya arenaria]